MIKYTDYDFYIDTYKGDMSENDFNKLVIEASYEVNKNIFNRDIRGYEEEIQLVTCSIADILLEINTLEVEKNSTILDKKIKSESVGDYSKTFETTNISDIEAQISNHKQRIKDELKKYLLQTGLLYRGV